MRRSALLLVDVLSDFAHEDGRRLRSSFEGRYRELRGLVEGARRSDVPIVYANDNGGAWEGDASLVVERAMAGPCGHRIARIAPRAGDRFVVKPRYSAFDLTPLDLVLRSLELERVVLAGMATEMCVTHTALAAEQHGYEVAVVPGACACIDPEHEATALAYLENVLEVELLGLDEALASLGDDPQPLGAHTTNERELR